MLFKKSKLIQQKADWFLDVVSAAAINYQEGIQCYLKEKREDFAASYQKVDKLENRADDLRREIENQLYSETLIPESRGDVLALLENMDSLVNGAKQVLANLSIEEPAIPDEFHDDLLELTRLTAAAVEAVVLSARNFLSDPLSVKREIHKVFHYESEADRVAEKLKRLVFQSSLELARKSHIRYFITAIDSLADLSENVADRMTIYTIKRSI